MSKRSPARKKRLLWDGILLVLIAALGFSGFQLARTLREAKQEQDAFSELSAMVSARRMETGGKTDPRTRPEAGSGVSPEEMDPAGGSAEEPPAETEIGPLPEYVEIAAANPDFFGWLSIPDTPIDYPVVYTPEDPEHYLRRAFDGTRSQSGVPFLDGRCDPDGNYYIIYGHHMRNGSMFGSLPSYADKTYWEAHPVICLDTRYERRSYQVLSAFFTKIYTNGAEDVFRYYVYTDLSEQEVFEEYLSGVLDEALYDTGVSAAFGDELLALSTCNYHTANGRFVVVAKRID